MSKTINQDNLNTTLRILDKMGEANLEQLKSTDPAFAERMEQLGTLLSRDGFVPQLMACPDRLAAVRLFADHGLVLTDDEITALVAQINGIARKLTDNNGILSEEDLEQINGGVSSQAWLNGIGGGICSAGIGSVIGTFFLPGVGSAIGAAIGGIVGGILLGSASDQ